MKTITRYDAYCPKCNRMTRQYAKNESCEWCFARHDDLVVPLVYTAAHTERLCGHKHTRPASEEIRGAHGAMYLITKRECTDCGAMLNFGID